MRGIGNLLEFFGELDSSIRGASEEHGILRKDIAAMLGYSSGSGLTNAIRRGTLKMSDFILIAREIGLSSSFEAWPTSLRDYLGKQSMFKVFSYVEFMRLNDEMHEAFRSLRDGGGGSK